MPAAKSFENGRAASAAMRNALPTSSMNAATTPIVPMRPSSSPIAVNTKSVAAFGMSSGLPEPEAGADDAARAERVLRLDDLVAVALARLPRVDPRLDAHAHVAEQRGTRARTPIASSTSVPRTYAAATRRDVEHRREHAEEEQRRADVLARSASTRSATPHASSSGPRSRSDGRNERPDADAALRRAARACRRGTRRRTRRAAPSRSRSARR